MTDMAGFHEDANLDWETQLAVMNALLAGRGQAPLVTTRIRYVVDTSAVVAIIKKEPGYENLVDAMAGASESLKMSAPVFLELGMVLSAVAPAEDALAMVSRFGVSVVAFDPAQARIALAAHARYGVRSGSKARLNLCDCMSYALATHLGEPLLFVGNDFVHTDVARAVKPAGPMSEIVELFGTVDYSPDYDYKAERER